MDTRSDTEKYSDDLERARSYAQGVDEVLLLSALDHLIEHVVDLEKKGASLYSSRATIKNICKRFHIWNPLENNAPGMLR